MRTFLVLAFSVVSTVNAADSLLLYPNSKIEIRDKGTCAVIENISDSLVFVPRGPALKAFVEASYAFVRIKPCG